MKYTRFNVPEYKKVRVIIDTDAACEADDPFAIVHGLLSPKLIVKSIIAEHFNVENSVVESYEEIKTILDLMGIDVPFYMGQKGKLSEDEQVSEGVQNIIDEAMMEDSHPLYILCQGAITNVAKAIETNPQIIDRINVIWIGTHGTNYNAAPFREFNAGNDVKAANMVLSSGVKLWLVPSYVYSTISIGIAEIERRIAPLGAIGNHLLETMDEYNNSEGATWTQGESWSLGDSPAIALAINPGCGEFEECYAPIIEDDTTSVEGDCSRPTIRVYKNIDSRYILEDFIAKLELWNAAADK